MCSPTMRVSVSVPHRGNLKRNPIAAVASKVNADPVHLRILTLSDEKETLIMSVFLQGTSILIMSL